MTDREKVIKGLEAHEKGCGYRSHNCDAMGCPYRYGDESCDIAEMCHDAIALLKEQGPITPNSKSRIGEYPQIVHRCGNCNEILYKYYKFCPSCGKEVKWE